MGIREWEWQVLPILGVTSHLTLRKKGECTAFTLHKGSEDTEVLGLTFFVFWIYTFLYIFFPFSKFWRSNKKYKQRSEETVICNRKDKSNHQSYKEKKST